MTLEQLPKEMRDPLFAKWHELKETSIPPQELVWKSVLGELFTKARDEYVAQHPGEPNAEMMKLTSVGVTAILISRTRTALSKMTREIQFRFMRNVETPMVQQWLAVRPATDVATVPTWTYQRGILASQLMQPGRLQPTPAQLSFIDRVFYDFHEKYHAGGEIYATLCKQINDAAQRYKLRKFVADDNGDAAEQGQGEVDQELNAD